MLVERDGRRLRPVDAVRGLHHDDGVGVAAAERRDAVREVEGVVLVDVQGGIEADAEARPVPCARQRAARPRQPDPVRGDISAWGAVAECQGRSARRAIARVDAVRSGHEQGSSRHCTGLALIRVGRERHIAIASYAERSAARLRRSKRRRAGTAHEGRRYHGFARTHREVTVIRAGFADVDENGIAHECRRTCAVERCSAGGGERRCREHQPSFADAHYHDPPLSIWAAVQDAVDPRRRTDVALDATKASIRNRRASSARQARSNRLVAVRSSTSTPCWLSRRQRQRRMPSVGWLAERRASSTSACSVSASPGRTGSGHLT